MERFADCRQADSCSPDSVSSGHFLTGDGTVGELQAVPAVHSGPSELRMGLRFSEAERSAADEKGNHRHTHKTVPMPSDAANRQTVPPELPGVPSTQISSELDAQITL